MGQTVHSGLVTANVLAGAISAFPAGSTLTGGGNANAGVSTNTVYTVTAGKTFYLCGFTVTATSDTAASGQVYLEADRGDGTYVKLALLYPTGMASAVASMAVTGTLPVPFPVPATKLVRVYVGAAMDGGASVWGYEV